MRISDWSSDVCSSDLGEGVCEAIEDLGPGVGVGAVGGVGGEDGDAFVCCGRVHAASVANEGLRIAAGMRTLRPVPIAPWIFLDSSLRPERLPGVVRPYGARSTHGAAVAVDTRACGSNHGSMAWINGPISSM